MSKAASKTEPAYIADTAPHETTDESQIRMRAYELYLQRGMVDGQDMDDWLQAEQEVHERLALAKAA